MNATIEQLIVDYVFEYENDEFIDTFEIQSMNDKYVIVRYEMNNEFQFTTMYVENIKRVMNK